MLLLPYIALLLASSQLALSQVTNFFVNPPNAGQPLLFAENDVFTIGDEIDVQWVTNQTEFSVWLWQQSFNVGAAVIGDTVFTKILGGPEQDGFNWTVTQQAFDLTQSNVFFFALGPPSQPQIASDTITSHYFNLTKVDQAAAPGSDTQNTTSATATATSTSATSAIQAPTSNSSTNNVTLSNPDQEKSTREGQSTISIGLGVGFGLGLPLLTAVLYLVIRHARRENTSITRKLAYPEGIKPAQVVDPFKVFSPQEVSGGDMFRLSKMQRGNELPAYHDTLAELPVEKPTRT